MPDRVAPGAVEKLGGIVERITFYSPDSGWSVLPVAPCDAPHARITVTLHQAEVFAGASIDFRGCWETHPLIIDWRKVTRGKTGAGERT